MKYIRSLTLTVLLLLCAWVGKAQKQGVYNAIYSGTPWVDDRGQVVSAHGANMVKDNDRYYLFGEAHTDKSNVFAGFNCYSSKDLYNWKFESLALGVQDTGRLAANRVGERVKVMKCPATREYVMLMHTDDLGYKDPCIGYATSKNITGPYKFQGPILFNGKPIRKWDMATFQDADGSGYLIIHSGLLFKLTNDYKSIAEQVVDNQWRGCESPTIFKAKGLYYWLTSDLTSWEKNDNFYYTATSLKGPWKLQGNFTPKGTLTYNSQTTFVLPIAGAKDTTYLFMGDRWSYPNQASAATYVWQPLLVSGTSLSIPQLWDAWQIDLAAGKTKSTAITGQITSFTDHQKITYKGQWAPSVTDTLQGSRSGEKDASFSFKFSGRQVAFYGLSGPDGGYGKITLTDAKGKILYTAMVDHYCKYPVIDTKYISPVLPKGNYTLTVNVLGERPNWSDKKKTQYGSTGNFVGLNKLIVR